MDGYGEFLNSAAGAIAMVLCRLVEDERWQIRGAIAEPLDAFGASGQTELPATSSALVSLRTMLARPSVPRRPQTRGVACGDAQLKRATPPAGERRRNGSIR